MCWDALNIPQQPEGARILLHPGTLLLLLCSASPPPPPPYFSPAPLGAAQDSSPTPWYIHAMGSRESQSAPQAAELEGLSGTGTGHTVLDTLLSFPQGLSPTQHLSLTGLEPADAVGSDGPMSPSCRALVCSSHFFWPVGLENQTKTTTAKRKMKLSKPCFPLDV